MTMTSIELPSAPPTVKLKGTLLDAADVTNGMEWIDDGSTVGLFDSYNCLDFRHSLEFCGPQTKDLDQAAVWQNGFVFGVYGGVHCKAIGLDRARMMSEVERVFALGEHIAVEQALMANRFVEGPEIPDSDPVTARWPEPEALTAVAVPVSVGIALLEGHAASHYSGTPTLHLPRTVASYQAAGDKLVYDGSLLRTKLGSKVAAGGGYDVANIAPDGTDAADGEYWLYATGEVLVRRGDLILKGGLPDGFDIPNNDVFVLAERAYMAAVDCYTVAVPVTLED